MVVVLLTAIAAQAVFFMKNKSVTADEMIFIKSGYQALTTGRYNVDDANPPLLMVTCALPLLGRDLELNPRIPEGVEVLEFGYDFLYYNPDPDGILFASRLPSLVFTLLLAMLVYRWAGELYGPRAGLLALFMFSFCPVLLGLAGLATPDLGSAFLVVLALYVSRIFYRDLSMKALILTALVTGLAMCAKHTAVVLIPCFVVFAVVGKRRGKALFWMGSAVLFALVVILTINVVYGFQGTGMPFGKLPLVEEEVFRTHPVFGKLLNPCTARIPVPLPYPFLRSLGSIVARTSVTEQWPCFLMDEVSTEGWWYYYIVAFLLKTPVPFLCIMLFCVVDMVLRRRFPARDELFLLVPAGIVFLLASLSSFQVGIRHILVVYPLLIVFVCRACAGQSKYRRLQAGVGAALALWYVLSAVLAGPHYLAYFNELAGGSRNGYRYLADSNVDWGQDVGNLVRYMDRNGIEKIKFGHWIGLDPRHSKRLEELGPGPATGWVAAQVNVVQGLTEAWGGVEPGTYEWLRKLEPVGMAGRSILVYYVPEK